jgi:hypothetical protein
MKVRSVQRKISKQANLNLDECGAVQAIALTPAGSRPGRLRPA